MLQSTARPAAAPALSILPDADGAPGLPVFASTEEALAAHCGDDPLFVLYPQRIAAAAELFLNGFSGRTMFAVKVNPHPAVLRTLWAAGIRDFDVASTREIDLVRGLLPGARMAFMHPVKPRAAIRAAYEAGVRDFAFDGEAELTKILAECAGADDLALHLRLALPTGGADALMDLSGKFGANFEDAATLLRAARPHCAKLGLTFHVGSQCMDPRAFSAAIAYARGVADSADVVIDSLDAGGGFPSRYPGMEPPAMSAYFETIEEAVRAHGFEGCELAAEPGRALVAEGGATLARVEMRRGRDLYLNDGAYGSLFDAAKFAWRYPVRAIREDAGDGGTEPFRFFGPTCDSADRMDGPFDLPADIEEGDWIEIGALGAYGQTMATRFNGYYSDLVAAVLDGAAQSAAA